MKFKVGEVWRTRDGRKARIIYTGVKSNHFPIIAVLENEDNSESSMFYTSSGRLLSDKLTEADLTEPWRGESEHIEVFEWMYQSSFGVWHFALAENTKDCRFQESKYCIKTGRSWKVPK